MSTCCIRGKQRECVQDLRAHGRRIVQGCLPGWAKQRVHKPVQYVRPNKVRNCSPGGGCSRRLDGAPEVERRHQGRLGDGADTHLPVPAGLGVRALHAGRLHWRRVWMPTHRTQRSRRCVSRCTALLCAPYLHVSLKACIIQCIYPSEC